MIEQTKVDKFKTAFDNFVKIFGIDHATEMMNDAVMFEKQLKELREEENND